MSASLSVRIPSEQWHCSVLALVGGTLSPSGSGMERWVFLCWLSRRVCRAVLQAEMLLRLLGGWCCRQVGADG